MADGKIYDLLGVHDTHPNVHFGKVAEGYGQCAGGFLGTPLVGKMRVRKSVILGFPNSGPLQRAGLDHGLVAVPMQNGRRMVRVVEAKAMPIFKFRHAPLYLTDDVGFLTHLEFLEILLEREVQYRGGLCCPSA